MEYETFYGKTYKLGNSIVITIPENLVKGANIPEKTTLKVMIRKHTESTPRPQKTPINND